MPLPDSAHTTRTIGDALAAARTALMGHSNAPRLDSERLLAHVLAKPREHLIAHDHLPLATHDLSTYEKLIALRLKGMPLPYLLGVRPFYDRFFRVNSHVLIPRQETEGLVEAALAWIRQEKGGRARIIDVGTGSGIIAVTLAAHLPESMVIGADISAAALSVAYTNGAELPNLAFLQADLLAPVYERFNLIAANLPYIATADMSLLEVAHFEPHIALDGGGDGLHLIRRLLAMLPTRITSPGLILLEHGADQGAAVRVLAEQTFPKGRISTLRDMAGLDRIAQILF